MAILRDTIAAQPSESNIAEARVGEHQWRGLVTLVVC